MVNNNKIILLESGNLNCAGFIVCSNVVDMCTTNYQQHGCCYDKTKHCNRSLIAILKPTLPAQATVSIMFWIEAGYWFIAMTFMKSWFMGVIWLCLALMVMVLPFLINVSPCQLSELMDIDHAVKIKLIYCFSRQDNHP